MVVAIICVLLALYLQEYRNFVEKAGLFEAFGLTHAVRAEMVVHYAEIGRWPESLASKASGRNVSSVRLLDGIIVAELRASKDAGQYSTRRALSFAPVTNEGPPSVIVWLCGHTEAPPGFREPAASQTIGLQSILPHTCRSRRVSK